MLGIHEVTPSLLASRADRARMKPFLRRRDPRRARGDEAWDQHEQEFDPDVAFHFALPAGAQWNGRPLDAERLEALRQAAEAELRQCFRRNGRYPGGGAVRLRLGFVTLKGEFPLRVVGPRPLPLRPAPAPGPDPAGPAEVASDESLAVVEYEGHSYGIAVEGRPLAIEVEPGLPLVVVMQGDDLRLGIPAGGVKLVTETADEPKARRHRRRTAPLVVQGTAFRVVRGRRTLGAGRIVRVGPVPEPPPPAAPPESAPFTVSFEGPRPLNIDHLEPACLRTADLLPGLLARIVPPHHVAITNLSPEPLVGQGGLLGPFAVPPDQEVLLRLGDVDEFVVRGERYRFVGPRRSTGTDFVERFVHAVPASEQDGSWPRGLVRVSTPLLERAVRLGRLLSATGEPTWFRPDRNCLVDEREVDAGAAVPVSFPFHFEADELRLTVPSPEVPCLTTPT